MDEEFEKRHSEVNRMLFLLGIETTSKHQHQENDKKAHQL